MHTVTSITDAMTQRFQEAGIPDPRVDAELLIGHVLGKTRGRVQALAILGEPITEDQRLRLEELASLREDRVPLQHLTGTAPFRHLMLQVGPGVFTPRPETETVVELGLSALPQKDDSSPIVVDLCTGSGAIAASIASERQDVRVWAVEKSVTAHAWAQRNLAHLDEQRVQLFLGDVTWLDPRQPDTKEGTHLREHFAPIAGNVDLLITNPPYVPEGMIPREPEVRDHDPHLALFSGEDGLDLIRVISRIGIELVKPGGSIVIEHAEHQGPSIRELLQKDGWNLPVTHQDLTGRDRTTTARR